MKKDEKQEAIRAAQNDANTAKERLMEISWRLYVAGAIREAKSLETIIGKLELWQNR